MLHVLISDFAACAPDVPVLLVEGEPWFAARLGVLADAWAARLHRTGHKRFGLCMAPSGNMIAALAALSRIDASVVILKDSLSAQELQRLAMQLECEAIVSDAASVTKLPEPMRGSAFVLEPFRVPHALPDLPHAFDGSVHMLSSGTTGSPKAIACRWRELAANIRSSLGGEPRRWLLAYSLAHFAGIQVLLQALVHRETLIVSANAQVPAMWAAARAGGATHVSSTPTFWRVAFASPACASPIATLRHVTLGGEVVTQDVLSRIATCYPDASISQVYASTELGSVVSVKDRRVGLPIALFDETVEGGARLRIVDSELEVRQGQGATAQYRPTGDLVTRTTDRVLFLGRKSEVINVGGIKVYPQEVEAVVNPIDGVAAAVADGRTSPITGQIVRLRVVLHPSYAREEVDQRIRSACRALGRHAQPRQIIYVDAIDTVNMKLARRAFS